MPRASRCIAGLALVIAAANAYAQVALSNRDQLLDALEHGGPCCVIDGRSEAQRNRRALTDALVYRPDMRITPTSAVVVVADSNREAMAIAETIGRAHPGKVVLAVDGGVIVWEGVMAKLNPAAGGLPSTFVIPKNTCEQGTPLQELRTAPK